MKSRQFAKEIFLNLQLVFITIICYSQSHQTLEKAGSYIYESNAGDSILHYKGYSIIYSYSKSVPLYSFNKITPSQLLPNSIPTKRTNRFVPVYLPNNTWSATHSDYYKTGYDRGHMVPAGDFVYDQSLKDETFYYININPQSPNLNRGIWANLENSIRSKVIQSQKDAYVITGILLNENDLIFIGPRGRLVPNAFFKIVYFPKLDLMYAFLFDNHIQEYWGNISDFQVTVDFLEHITKENFFDRLNETVQNDLESRLSVFK